ncbi:hypothetical protein LguiA_034067 [Lonicera macranthoides]
MISFLIWNLRGISNTPTISRLHKLVKIHKVCLVVFLEPMVEAMQVENFKLKLGFDKALSNVNSKVWVMWKDNIKVSVVRDFEQCLAVKYKHSELEGDFIFTATYAKCSRVERRVLWRNLSELCNMGYPCIIGGDFNIVCFANERLGGNPIDFGAAGDLNDCVLECGLMDLDCTGSQFTWKKPNCKMWQRLDRVLCSQDWLSKFQVIKLSHLNRENSDHSPLVVQFGDEQRNGGCFSFQRMWISHHDFLRVVQSVWDCSMVGDLFQIFSSKLNKLKKELIRWNKEAFGQIDEKVIQAEAQLLDTESRMEIEDSEEAVEAVESARHQLNRILDQEELFWRQRAKVKWLKEGDRNSNFFHVMANHRRRKAKIHRIQNAEGNWVTTQEDIMDEGVRFFQHQFTGNLVNFDFNLVHRLIPGLVNEEMNNMIVQRPSENEIFDVIKDMDVDSAPGPDGFGGHFY